jgi:uncharacterized damage-inducible protein DinB
VKRKKRNEEWELDMLQHIHRMASYNQFMNNNLLAAAAKLPAAALRENQGAFFGSILGTLNHVLVGDLLWLNRFKLHSANYTTLDALASFPVPNALDQLLYDNLSDFSLERQKLDSLILEWVPQIILDDLSRALRYKRVNGEENSRAFDGLLMHFFNHQTHHRGQATTLFSQAGVDVCQWRSKNVPPGRSKSVPVGTLLPVVVLAEVRSGRSQKHKRSALGIYSVTGLAEGFR